MAANRFIEILEAKHFMPPEGLVELRRRVAESRANLPAELLARILVDNGHLTKFQASSIIKELHAASAEWDDSIGLANPEVDVPEAILEFESDSPTRNRTTVSGSPESLPSPTYSYQSIRSTKSHGTSSAKVKAGSRADAATDSAKTDSRDGAIGTHQESIFSAPRLGAPRKNKDKVNPWDSFRILGVGVILGLTCIAGFFLVRWMVRGNADDAMKFADSAYQQRNYEDASNAYKKFADSWPTHELASYARIRAVLATLRRDVETASNPLIGLRAAEELLPTLLGQSALPEQQSDLAGTLVSLSEKFIAKIDATKGNTDRKSLMAEMAKLMAFISDPQFVGSTQRNQLAPTLRRVEESRSRLEREIARDDELAAALTEIDQFLDKRQVLEAYETRGRLITRYPLLEANAEINKRVHRASDIQRELVKDGSLAIQVESSPRDEQKAKVYLLTNRRGRPIPELSETLIYYQIKDTVVALDGNSGKVLWHKLVGLGLDSPPIRLSNTPDSDVLVAQRELGQLMRLDGRTGQVKWLAKFGEILYQPAVRGDDIFVSTQSGVVINLDAISGNARWMKQLPQAVDVGPCAVAGSQWIYQPASHSDIYVLDSRDGTCPQVAYSGHRPGAFRVAPVLALQHLFLIENINSQSARIHAMAVTKEGLKQVQPPIAVDGNVMTPPCVDGRQILIQSDLGHGLVLDIDPSSSKEKVSVTARVPRNFDSSRAFWTAFRKNQVWLAENRLARFDLVVTQGQLNRRWIQHDGDEFVGPLQLFGDYLVHARRLRGNQGVTISAAKAEDGIPIWEVDLGVPVALLSRTNSDRFDAILNNGSYFAINEHTIRDSANANPGEGKPQKRFSQPVWVTPALAVMLNSANSNEFALYSAQDNPALRILNLPLGSAQPSGEAVAHGEKVLIGLDVGQLVEFAPTTGQLDGAAYQAIPTTPGQRIQWNRPVYFPDSSLLVAAIEAGDASKIMSLNLGDSMSSLREEFLDRPIIGPLVRLGELVAGIQSAGGGGEVLTQFDSNLKASKQQPLDGRLLAGPFNTPDAAVLQTEKNLIAFDASGSKRWSIPFHSNPLVGPPYFTKDNLSVATLDGTIWVIDPAGGLVRGNVDLGQRLSTPPIVHGNRIVVGTDNGSVLVLPVPSESVPMGEVR